MKKFYKRLALLIVFVLAISSAVIYFTVDINTIKNLTIFKPESLALAIFFVGVGLFLDGTRLMRLVHISHENIKLSEAVQVVFGNYFLALLTPVMTGGAVAQLMFLKHAGVPVGKATVVVLVRTIVSILFLMLCCPFIFMHDEHILPGLSNAHLLVITLTIVLVIVLVIVGIKKNFFNHLAVYIARKLPSKYRRAFIKVFRDTHQATKLLASSPLQMMIAFAESGLSLMCIYAVVPCLFFGLGVTDTDIPQHAALLHADAGRLGHRRGRLRLAVQRHRAGGHRRNRRRELAAHSGVSAVLDWLLLHGESIRHRLLEPPRDEGSKNGERD